MAGNAAADEVGAVDDIHTDRDDGCVADSHMAVAVVGSEVLCKLDDARMVAPPWRQVAGRLQESAPRAPRPHRDAPSARCRPIKTTTFAAASQRSACLQKKKHL